MQQPTRIIAVRHGETAWNVDTRIQGHLDIPLNDTGRWQAQRLGQALAERHSADAEAGRITAIYSSDLQRARQTAEAIRLATGAPLNLHPGLRERGFGAFEGLTYAEIEQRWPQDALHWRKRVPDWAPPPAAPDRAVVAPGESLLQVRERITHTLAALAAPHAGQLIVLVAHGGVMDQLYRLATAQDLQAPRSWQLGNAALNHLLWTPEGMSLVGWADTSHLEGQGLDETSA
ncbi:phosphoglycerate mutase [Hylemonella gracilis str. Niagara R]|uniref:Phosphoglycerate mutase n=1 Tax=Hylemonella gracilis str. Niagara R TaxID=1458275 RepID=A0A016XEN4_9BURK|nr:histidine phosphatase family protein [Hylemonella gracilis]EYC50296.1 phosphoglycerate mutase [Hylemonella gracilis str. Niagara R]